ncbi:MAG: hypothetical protein D6682_02205 [Zetaproteobacteria bacterium]|nr:MAG: hypothetical protein D6682_02205 [Zetaproteobacteria bacterium]
MARILGINWVEGEMHCAYMDGNKLLGAWDAPAPVHELHEFNLAIRDVCSALKVRQGSLMAMSYESRLISHPFVHVPVMKREDLEKVLFRRADQEKVFEGQASWSWTRTLPSKEGDGVLLHLMPRSARNAIIRICEEFYLTPVRMVPLSEVMGRHLVGLTGGDDRFHMLVALFANQMEIMVARGDGTLLFLRDISTRWGGDAGRVQQEAERTALYAKQQFGVTIAVLWLAGSGAEQVAEQIGDRVSADEVRVDPIGNAAAPWAQEVTRLPSRLTSNLVPWYVQQRPRRRMIMRGTLLVLGVLLLLTVGTVVSVELLLRDHREDGREIAARMEVVQRQLAALERKAKAVEEEERRLRLFAQLELPQAPLLFLRHLATVVPDDLVLRRVEVSGRGERWPFSLQGAAGKDPDHGLELVERLEQGLTAPPMAATITLHGAQSWQRAVQQGDARSLARPLSFTLRGEVR